MIVKVCGMRDPQNIRAVGLLPINWMGFILYPESPRFAGDIEISEISELLPVDVKKVGVLVNPELYQLLVAAALFDVVQIHGDWVTPEMCNDVRIAGKEVVRVFPISEATDFETCLPYEGTCNYYLFDTKGLFHGGNGTSFDWNLLQYYTGETPFLLSGGIGADDADKIFACSHPLFAGIDLNSRFEKTPALKDVDKLRTFIKKVKYAAEQN